MEEDRLDVPVEEIEAVPEGERVPTADTDEDFDVVGVRDVVADADVVRVPVFVAEILLVEEADRDTLAERVEDVEPDTEFVALEDFVEVPDGDADRVPEGEAVAVSVVEPVGDPDAVRLEDGDSVVVGEGV